MIRWIIISLLALAGWVIVSQPATRINQSQMAEPPQFIGNPEIGEQLFSTFQPVAGTACSTCHRVDSEERLIGPGLLHISERAANGANAVEYIRTSIVDPGAVVVDGYANIMPQNWEQVFSEEELNDLIAYLLTL